MNLEVSFNEIKFEHSSRHNNSKLCSHCQSAIVDIKPNTFYGKCLNCGAYNNFMKLDYMQRYIWEELKKNRVILSIGAKRTGKTAVDALWFARQLLTFPGYELLVISFTKDQLDRTGRAELLKHIPNELITSGLKTPTITLSNGSKAHFISSENYGSIKGLTVTGAWAIEADLINHLTISEIKDRVSDLKFPCYAKDNNGDFIYEENKLTGQLEKKILHYNSTLIYESNFEATVHSLFPLIKHVSKVAYTHSIRINSWINGLFYKINRNTTPVNKDWCLILTSIVDSTRPDKDDYIRNVKSGKSNDEIEQQLHGDVWKSDLKIVKYDGYQPNVPNMDPKNWVITTSIDFGGSIANYVCLVFATDTIQWKHWLIDWYYKNAITSDQAAIDIKKFISKYSQYQYAWGVCDPAGANRDHNLVTIIDKFKARGINTTPGAKKNKEQGIIELNTLLLNKDLFICNNIFPFFNEVVHYNYKNKDGVLVIPDENISRRQDCMDTLIIWAARMTANKDNWPGIIFRKANAAKYIGIAPSIKRYGGNGWNY